MVAQRVTGEVKTLADPNTVAFRIVGAASQTADLIQLRDSNANVLTKVEANGRLVITPTAVVANALVEAAAVAGQAYPLVMGRVGASWVAAINPTGFDSYFQGRFAPTNASTVPLIAKGAASQTADMFQVQDSSGIVYFNVGQYGNIATNIGTTGGSYPGRLSVGTGTATTIGAVIRGVASQTANLQEWQNSAGTVMSFVSPAGGLAVAGGSLLGASLGVLPLNSSTIGAVIRGVASQTADLQRWQDSSAVNLLGVTSAGVLYRNNSSTETALFGGANPSDITFKNTSAVNSSYNSLAFFGSGSSIAGGLSMIYIDTANGYAQFRVSTRSSAGWNSAALAIYEGGGAYISNNVTTRLTLAVRGAVSQSANLQEWQDSAGTALAKVNSIGRVEAPYVSVGGLSGLANVRLVVNPSAAEVGAVIRASASQTGNLQEWQDSSGNILGLVSASGRLSIRGTSVTAALNVYTAGTSTVGAIIAGVPSQTGDLTQWQNSSGTVIAGVSAAGFGFFGLTGASSGQVSIQPSSTSTVGLMVRGAASQTANLQEWQNSAGSILAKMASDGQLFATNLSTINSRGRIIEYSNGAYIQLLKSTVTANPGANILNMAVRDGTTAGTLKLVVRAGTAGGETTIIDDIDQSAGGTTAKFVGDGSGLTGISGGLSGSIYYESQNSTDTSIEMFNRMQATSSLGLYTGVVHFTMFTPAKDMTITNLSYMAAATSTGRTLVRFGLYTWDDSTQTGTLVAQTANDTTLLATNNTLYTKALDTTGGYPASYNLVAGTRYALAVIQVGSSNAWVKGLSPLDATMTALSPRLCGYMGSQTDLPTSASSLTASTALAWGKVS